MKQILSILLSLIVLQLTAQEQTKEDLIKKEANNLVYKANELVASEDVVSAEMEYRKALSKQSKNVAGAYNLGNIHYLSEGYDEALFILQEAAKNASNKTEKHRAFHNIGNILMKNELCKEAVEAFKNALRSDPSDDETRYNLALAKECAKNQDGGGEDNKEDEDQDKKDEEEKDKKDKEDQEKEDNKKDEGDKDKKQGDEEEDDKGKPKDEKKDNGEGDDNKKPQQKKPQPGKLSPQQIKNILEAMNNQEQKVQEKMNAKKEKGAKVKKEKDW